MDSRATIVVRGSVNQSEPDAGLHSDPDGLLTNPVINGIEKSSSYRPRRADPDRE